MCEVTQRGVRGPKRGHLRALKDRILHLETMLATRQGGQQQQLDDAPVYSPEFSRSEPGMEEDMAERGSEVDDISAPFSLPGGVASAYDPSAFLAPPSLTGSSREQDKSMSPEIGGLSGNHLHIPEVMRDELYVDHQDGYLVKPCASGLLIRWIQRPALLGPCAPINTHTPTTAVFVVDQVRPQVVRSNVSAICNVDAGDLVISSDT